MPNNFVRAGNLDSDFEIDSLDGKIRAHSLISGTGVPSEEPAVPGKTWAYFDVSVTPANIYVWDVDDQEWQSAGAAATTAREVVLIAYGPDEAAVAGDGALFFTVPALLDGYVIGEIWATTPGGASSSGDVQVQVARVRAGSPVDVLSTKVTIEESETSSKTATTQPVVNTSNDDLATGDFLRVDIDNSGTDALGLQVIVSMDLP